MNMRQEQFRQAQKVQNEGLPGSYPVTVLVPAINQNQADDKINEILANSKRRSIDWTQVLSNLAVGAVALIKFKCDLSVQKRESDARLQRLKFRYKMGKIFSKDPYSKEEADEQKNRTQTNQAGN